MQFWTPVAALLWGSPEAHCRFCGAGLWYWLGELADRDCHRVCTEAPGVVHEPYSRA